MRFLSLETENFRMLRGIKFNFSNDPEKPVTVIRAENETGKTTLWRAVAWLLYGEDYLRGLRDYQLTPKSWVSEGKGNRCEIRVSLEFSVLVKSDMEEEPSVKKYNFARTLKERYLENESKFIPVDTSSIELFEYTDDGLTPINPPERAKNLVRSFFPKELLDIFLLNGDSMESQMFSATQNETASRTAVEDFLKRAMDIKIYENSKKHTKTVGQRIRLTLGETMEGDEATLTEEINSLENRIDGVEADINDSKEKITNLENEKDRLTTEIDNAQQQGSREDLIEEKRILEGLQNQEIDNQMKHVKLMSDNFSSKALAIDCLFEEKIAPFKIRVANLKDEGVIPRQTVPFLERIILQNEKCICGDDLSAENEKGIIRRDQISKEIEKSKEQDETSDLLSQLDYQCVSMNIWETETHNKWLDSQEDFHAEFISSREQFADYGAKINNIDAQLDNLSNTDVASLRTSRESVKSSLQEERGRLESLNLAELRNNDRLQEKSNELERVRIRNAENTSINAQFDLINDINTVFTKLLSILQTEKAEAVSNEMNKMFLGMTGEEDENIGPIKSVRITEEKDVVVTTKEDIQFSPRDNLNGASLRALTLSFVLALCKESGKSLPHIIDTPFGMTSGTRKSMLEIAIANSEQVILCLTPSEIRGLEETLMQSTSREYSYSLSFSDHYPRFLKNKISEISESVKCDCSFLEWCQKCERKEWDNKTIFDKELYAELITRYE